MPVARKYPNNAARQKAYRERKKDVELRRNGAETAGTRALVERVMKAESR